jgi:hypothetical protein
LEPGQGFRLELGKDRTPFQARQHRLGGRPVAAAMEGHGTRLVSRSRSWTISEGIALLPGLRFRGQVMAEGQLPV